MLVLTRKVNEQIKIGEDITITLVRIKGNCVRIGIEAPREVRVMRGELAANEEVSDLDVALEFAERESAFAHPQPRMGRHTKRGSIERLVVSTEVPQPNALAAPQVYVGRIRPMDRDGLVDRDGRKGRAPLAGFVSAT